MAPNQRQRQLVLSKKELKKINGRRFSKYTKFSSFFRFCKLLYGMLINWIRL